VVVDYFLDALAPRFHRFHEFAKALNFCFDFLELI
jgi:hypothetical protein